MAPLLRQSAIALFAALCLACAGAAEGAPPYRVVGYATDWDAQQARRLEHIDALIFAFAKVEGNEVVLPGDAAARLARLVALKQARPALRVVVAVGGWGAGGFSEAAATVAGREAFARSAAQLVQAHGADGIDVDWEYPGRTDAGIAASPATAPIAVPMAAPVIAPLSPPSAFASASSSPPSGSRLWRPGGFTAN